MTIAFPDVSNHEGNMPLEANTVACGAKATEGTTFKDAYYAHYKAEAARVGAVFFAYHFLDQGNGAAQAAFCHSIVGNDVALMLDFEPIKDAAGNYISKPSMQDAIDFITAYRRAGGRVVLVYLPHWYWKELGSPSLAAFSGMGLVSSAYTTYSDTGEGWAAYGGMTPVIWQWTDSLSYSGQSVDFNAYKGTVDQLRALLGYDDQEDEVALTDAEIQRIIDGVHDSILNHQLGEIDVNGKPTGGTITVGAATARSRAVEVELKAAIGAVDGKVAALTAPVVDAKALAEDLGANAAFVAALASAVAAKEPHAFTVTAN